MNWKKIEVVIVKFVYWYNLAIWILIILSFSPTLHMSKRSSGWNDLSFIPPGRSRSQHVQEINA